MRTFVASHNEFSTIPNSFITHTTIISVDLSYNNFNSSYTQVLSRLPVPASSADTNAGNCLQCIFRTYTINENEKGIFYHIVVIDLSYNQIYAAETSYQFAVSQWPNLISIKLNNNGLNKQLQVVGYSNPYLKTIDLSYNQLLGSVPPEFTQFVALTYPFIVPFSASSLISPRDLNLQHNNLSSSTLPSGFHADYDVVTYYSTINVNCPTIRLNSGVAANMDPEYHSFDLCQCETNYRRRNLTDTSDILQGQVTFL